MEKEKKGYYSHRGFHPSLRLALFTFVYFQYLDILFEWFKALYAVLFCVFFFFYLTLPPFFFLLFFSAVWAKF